VTCNNPYVLISLNDDVVGESKPIRLPEHRNPIPEVKIRFICEVTNRDPNARLVISLRDKSRLSSTEIGRVRTSWALCRAVYFVVLISDCALRWLSQWLKSP
jgi:hypothetical protein